MKILWDSKFDALAIYNSEIARGILHSPEWIIKMRDLQQEYNDKLFCDCGREFWCSCPVCDDDS